MDWWISSRRARLPTRFLAHENLYRPDDGHYQFKYLPAFAPLMAPFNWVSTARRRGHMVRA